MERIKKIAVPLSGVMTFFISTCFAWTIFSKNIPQNIATWIMVLILDIVGVVLVFNDGNKKPYLQMGWTISAFLVTSAIVLNDNPWHWGMVESVSFALCVISIVIWIKASARKALWAYMAASYISCFPLIVDYWNIPQPATLWVWVCTIGACLLSIYGSKKDFANVFVPLNAIVANGIIAVLCVL